MAQLVIDQALEQLPRRPIDGAIVVRCKDAQGPGETVKPARVFKLNSVDGGKVFVKRSVSLTTPRYRTSSEEWVW